MRNRETEYQRKQRKREHNRRVMNSIRKGFRTPPGREPRLRKQELHCHHCNRYVQFEIDTKLDGKGTAAKLKAMNVVVGATCPKCELYTEADLANAEKEVAGKTEAEALVAYLQGLGKGALK